MDRIADIVKVAVRGALEMSMASARERAGAEMVPNTQDMQVMIDQAVTSVAAAVRNSIDISQQISTVIQGQSAATNINVEINEGDAECEDDEESSSDSGESGFDDEDDCDNKIASSCEDDSDGSDDGSGEDDAADVDVAADESEIARGFAASAEKAEEAEEADDSEAEAEDAAFCKQLLIKRRRLEV
jgi:hypothetical protein